MKDLKEKAREYLKANNYELCHNQPVGGMVHFKHLVNFANEVTEELQKELTRANKAKKGNAELWVEECERSDKLQEENTKLREGIKALLLWMPETYHGSETDEQIEQLLQNKDDTLITAEWLCNLHPELTIVQAGELKRFCSNKTIMRKECYGDGSYMYPRWKAATAKLKPKV